MKSSTPVVARRDRIDELRDVTAPRFRLLNASLSEAVRLCGEVELDDITAYPELYHIVRSVPGDNAGTHRHPFTEMSMITDSPMEYFVGDAWLAVEQWQVVLIPADQPHAWRNVSGSAALLHGFMLDIFARSDAEDSLALQLNAAAKASRYVFPTTPAARTCFKQLESLAAVSSPYAPMAAAGCVRTLLALLLDHARRKVADLAVSGKLQPPTPTELLWLRARSYILRSLDDGVTAAAVAKAVGVTLRHLNRAFAAAHQPSCGQFIIGHQLERAKRLLREDGRIVKEVAAACGFTQPAYFSRVFRKHFGTTPAAYRGECSVSAATKHA